MLAESTFIMSISLPKFHLPQNPIKKPGLVTSLVATTVTALTQLPVHAQQVVELPATFVCTETTARGNKFEYSQTIHTTQAFNTFKKWCAGEIPGPDHQYVTNGVFSVKGNQPSATIQHPQTIPTPPAPNTTLNVYAAQCEYSKPWTDTHGNPSNTHERVYTYSQPFTNSTPNGVALVESVRHFCLGQNGKFSVKDITTSNYTNEASTTYKDRRINH